MTRERDKIKIVVWDSIGNTLLGVRPWASWEPAIQEVLLAEDPAAQEHALPLADILDEWDIDLVWFNSADEPYVHFGQLYADYGAALRFTRNVDEIMAEVADADFVVLHKERLPAAAIRNATKLRLIQHLGEDARGVPLETARERGIPVAATPLVNYITVAEQVWAYILNWSKRLPALRQHMRDRAYAEHWTRFPGTRYVGDMTLGLLGMGEIARPIARVAQAFGMRVMYWDIVRFPELEARYGMTFVEWDDLFRESDVVSAQLALNPQTENIIAAREFALMKPDALFINTARGGLVDEQALVTALKDGLIAGAGFDVLTKEPPKEGNPLLDLRMPNFILTPHVAWASDGAMQFLADQLIDNIELFLKGTPQHLVT